MALVVVGEHCFRASKTYSHLPGHAAWPFLCSVHFRDNLVERHSVREYKIYEDSLDGRTSIQRKQQTKKLKSAPQVQVLATWTCDKNTH